MVFSIMLIVLGILGLTISMYFTLLHYDKLSVDAWFIPAFCRLEEKSCKTILSSPYARMFSIPNSLLGIGFYFIALLVAIIGVHRLSSALLTFMVTISCCTVILGIYLTYALLFKLKIPCLLCIISHSINLIIFLVLLFTRMSNYHGSTP